MVAGVRDRWGRCPAWRSARRTPRRRHREAELSAEAPPRGELRGLRERIDDRAPGRNAAARVAETPEPRQGRRLGLRGAVACPQAHRRASTRGNGPRVEMKAGDRERGACHRPTSGTRGYPNLSRCSDRTYEQHQTNEEATTHHATLPRAAARVPFRTRSPFYCPWRSSCSSDPADPRSVTRDCGAGRRGHPLRFDSAPMNRVLRSAAARGAS